MVRRQGVMLVAVVVGALGFLAAGALAQPPGPPAGPRAKGRPGGRRMPTVDQIFQRFDANGDGKLTKDELPEGMADRMMRADTDGDGALSKAELEAVRKRFADRGPGGRRPSPEQIFARLDKNGDGKLTKDELPERLAERIMQADANKDGEVTKEELVEAAKRFAQGRPGQQRQFDPERVIQRLDKNGDGQLEKAELPGPLAERLMRADANGDGKLTKSELEAARKQFGARTGAPGRDRFDPARLFQRMDRNGDGKLTKEELPERFAERILQADTDGDGVVTKEEFLKRRGPGRPRPKDG